MNGTKLLTRERLSQVETVKVPRVTLPLHEQPTEKAPAISVEAVQVQRLRNRAAALRMDFTSYLDMLIERDYLAYLDWQRRQIAREVDEMERSGAR